MHTGLRAVLIVAVMFLTMAGCDSDDGASTPENAVASDYSGTWTGTYALSGEQTGTNIPFSLDEVTGVDETGVVAGSLASEFVAGAFAGTLNGNGVVVGEVDSTVDGSIWIATVEKTEDGLLVDLNNQALLVSGEAVPSAPANGINYKTTVTNATDIEVPITLYTSHLLHHAEATVRLAPGASYTYQTGAYCPQGITSYGPEETDPEMLFWDTACHGWVEEKIQWLWPCCSSRNWRIEPNTRPEDRYCTWCPKYQLTRL